MDIFADMKAAEERARAEYKWIESEKAGFDLGHNAELEWDRMYLPDFRRHYMGIMFDAIQASDDLARVKYIADDLRAIMTEYCGRPWHEKKYA
jgi:hypothetical protein